MTRTEDDHARQRRPHEPKVKCRAIGATSDFMKAMANSVRLAVLCVLMEGARTVGELEEILDVHQPTLSQQIGELRDAGIIVGRRVAKAVVYRLADPRAGQLIAHLRLLFADPEASGIWRGAQFEAGNVAEMAQALHSRETGEYMVIVFERTATLKQSCAKFLASCRRWTYEVVVCTGL